MTAMCDYGCGTKDKKGDPNAKLNHENYIKIENSASTFLERGYEGEICTYCGKKLGGKETPKLNVPVLNEYVMRYTGEKYEPVLTITDEDGKEISADNYRVRYNDNKNPGLAYANVVMKNPYGGEINVYYAITPDKVSVSSIKRGGDKVKITIGDISSRINGFEIEASTDKDFASDETILVETNSKANSKGILTVDGIDEKYKYLRIRTFVNVQVDEKDKGNAINDKIKDYVTAKKVYSEWSGVE